MLMEGPQKSLVSLEEVGAPVPRGEERQRRAIECAAALFLRDGIANVKMTDIADAAGVGVATLYRRFSTKTRIAIAAATLMWERFNERISGLVESSSFLAMSGAERLETLLREYSANYVANREFVSFLDEFDHLVLAEGATAEEMAGYGREVDSFYLIFEDAYQLGTQDGSVAPIADFRLFYSAVAHALIGVAEKLARGEVIPSDDFSRGNDELECIVDMAVRSIKAS
ncbi:MAG: TetR/AcrR family transcriptional regulator [Olsenella sp.]|jgi:AcrR family transcriptional regulator|nr:TetR/AcrR family transcriptional regulator [Olsenella sp.]